MKLHDCCRVAADELGIPHDLCEFGIVSAAAALPQGAKIEIPPESERAVIDYVKSLFFKMAQEKKLRDEIAAKFRKQNSKN